MDQDSRLGNLYEDEATGFRGKCVGIWIGYNTTQFSLAYMDGNNPKTVWLDSQRLKLVSQDSRTGF